MSLFNKKNISKIYNHKIQIYTNNNTTLQFILLQSLYNIFMEKNHDKNMQMLNELAEH